MTFLSLHISYLDTGAHSTDSRQWTGTSELMRCGGSQLRGPWQGLHERGIYSAECSRGVHRTRMSVSCEFYTTVRHKR
jgi:hypothetical protein